METNQFSRHSMEALQRFIATGTKTEAASSQSADYCNAVDMGAIAYRCVHGHPGCAAWHNGPCSDELASAFDGAA